MASLILWSDIDILQGSEGVIVRLYLDPETAQPHIFRHQVTEDEFRMYCNGQWKTVQALKILAWHTVKLGPAAIFGWCTFLILSRILCL